MEVDGIIEMFQWSLQKHNVRYAFYIGDGDTKTFKRNCTLRRRIYCKKKRMRITCKKRLYKRAKEAKKQLTQLKKAQKQLENKNTKGKSKSKSKSKAKEPKTATLTNKAMQDLSLYYGLAIRRHPDSVEKMRSEIWATYYHKISTDEKPQHHFCPEGVESWCKWRQHEAAGTLASFSHPPALDEDTQQVLKPIYEELTQDDLLERFRFQHAK